MFFSLAFYFRLSFSVRQSVGFLLLNPKMYMMKNVCFTLVLGCFFNIFFAKAAYVPVPVTGFNADVVANGTGSPSTSTTATLNYDVPTSGVVLVAPDYRYMASCSLPTASLPANRIVNGTTAGLTF